MKTAKTVQTYYAYPVASERNRFKIEEGGAGISPTTQRGGQAPRQQRALHHERHKLGAVREEGRGERSPQASVVACHERLQRRHAPQRWKIPRQAVVLNLKRN